MLEFYFSTKEEKDGRKTVEVFAHRGWSTYTARITFSDVLFSNCPKELIWNIYCGLATEEEVEYLRSLHDFPESYHVYCFEDTSEYYIKGPVERDKSGKIDPQFLEGVRNSLSLIQQRKTLIIAQSVKIVALRIGSSFGHMGGQGQKGNFYDLPESWQRGYLRNPDTKEIAEVAIKEAENTRTDHHP
jgi:hypothetical protein